MTERDKQSSAPHESAQPEPWQILALAEALDATPVPVEDIALGAGHLFLLGSKEATTLVLYPTAHVVRLIGPDMYLELAHQAPPQIHRRGAVFRTSETRDTQDKHNRLIVTNEGDALLSLQHRSFPNVTESPNPPASSPKRLSHRSQR